MDEFFQPEVGIAAAVTAIVLHPTPRRVLRRALVLGLAGALGVAESAKGLAGGVRTAPTVGQDIVQEAQDVHHARGKRKTAPPEETRS